MIHRHTWPVPPIFKFLQEKGNIPEEEMLRTFNNGVGLVMVVNEGLVSDVLLRLQGLHEQAFVMGEIAGRKPEEPPVVYV